MSEFWERFAFYGIRWALVLYIVAQFHGGSATGQADANLTYGSYLALVYATAIFGGYIADKVIGYQRSILTGRGVHGDGTVHDHAAQARCCSRWAWPRSSSATACSSRSSRPSSASCTRSATSGATAASPSSTWASTPAPSWRRCSPAGWRTRCSARTPCRRTSSCSCRRASACWSAWSGSTSAARSSRASAPRRPAPRGACAWCTW